jgi:hypothetical protein
MNGTDDFTENDLRYFQSIEDKLACGCGGALWGVKYNQLTERYQIKCLNCKKHLALRELYNVNFKTKVMVNDDLQTDCGVKKDHDTLDYIWRRIAEVQAILQNIQITLIKEAEKA